MRLRYFNVRTVSVLLAALLALALLALGGSYWLAGQIVEAHSRVIQRATSPNGRYVAKLLPTSSFNFTDQTITLRPSDILADVSDGIEGRWGFKLLHRDTTVAYGEDRGRRTISWRDTHTLVVTSSPGADFAVQEERCEGITIRYKRSAPTRGPHPP